MSAGGGGAQAAHSLAFRVMRLCRPTVETSTLKFDPCDLFFGEDLFDDPIAASHLPRLLTSINVGGQSDNSDMDQYGPQLPEQVLLNHPSDSIGLPGLLVLPQSFGDGDGERKYLPQFFKFMVSNPLSVRTKVRVVKENTFLEACIENNTKSNLYMDQVEFEPAQNWTAIVLKADGHLSEHNLLTRELFKEPILIRAGGGIYNYLYQLRLSSQDSARVKLEGSNVLGKLQITWRTNLGEPGRLQTQNILGNSIARKEIELQAVEVPSVIILEKPFVARLNLVNQTDRVLGPFEVWLSESNTLDEKTVMVNGLQTMTLGEVQASSSLEFQLNLIAVKNGIQKISGITVLDTIEKKTYDSLLELEIYVDSE